MNLGLLDWAIVAVPVVTVLVFAAYTRRHVQSAADFLSGGRIAGRYLVAVSDGVAAMGLITVIAFFEFFYKSGFAVNYWSQLQVPVTLIVALTGFVIYRFRETRALTLAQFFEQRYSRRFRLFAGWLAALAGIINYGIFPAVAGRFFIHYVGLPETFVVLGVPISTYAASMFVFLATALIVVLFGGQMAIMVSDCIQGMLTIVMIVIITVVVLYLFGWDRMVEAMSSRPPGESMINPFDSFAIQDFNIWFALIGLIGSVYMTMAWQGNQGYNCAAASPHEAKIGKLLGGWRSGLTYAMVLLLAIAAYTYLNHESFATASKPAQAALASIDNDVIRTQVEVPVAIAHFLPAGITGMFLATMLFLMLSTHTTYLHSWGSIVIQDIVLPLRKRPFTPREQLWYLRLSISAVALFAFLFSLLYAQTTYILMFFALTGSIYLGGAGACIIGGLYWSRGTRAGAWAAMLTGAGVALLGFTMEHGWKTIAGWLLERYPTNEFLLANADRFFINGQWMWLCAMLSAIAAYVILSLATCRAPFNMERLLHRGKYARAEDRPVANEAEPRGWLRLVGIDRSFTRGDKLIAGLVFVWSMGLFGIWLVATIWNFFQAWSTAAWANYFWITGVAVALGGGVFSTFWFIWGGTRDLVRFFRQLKTIDHHVADDGRVVGAVNVEEAITVAGLSATTAESKSDPKGGRRQPDDKPIVT